MSCEHVIHTSERCQRDLRWTVIATYSPTTPPAVNAIATGYILIVRWQSLLVVPAAGRLRPPAVGSSVVWWFAIRAVRLA